MTKTEIAKFSRVDIVQLFSTRVSLLQYVLPEIKKKVPNIIQLSEDWTIHLVQVILGVGLYYICSEFSSHSSCTFIGNCQIPTICSKLICPSRQQHVRVNHIMSFLKTSQKLIFLHQVSALYGGNPAAGRMERATSFEESASSMTSCREFLSPRLKKKHFVVKFLKWCQSFFILLAQLIPVHLHVVVTPFGGIVYS